MRDGVEGGNVVSRRKTDAGREIALMFRVTRRQVRLGPSLPGDKHVRVRKERLEARKHTRVRAPELCGLQRAALAFRGVSPAFLRRESGLGGWAPAGTTWASGRAAAERFRLEAQTVRRRPGATSAGRCAPSCAPARRQLQAARRRKAGPQGRSRASGAARLCRASRLQVPGGSAEPPRRAAASVLRETCSAGPHYLVTASLPLSNLASVALAASAGAQSLPEPCRAPPRRARDPIPHFAAAAPRARPPPPPLPPQWPRPAPPQPLPAPLPPPRSPIPQRPGSDAGHDKQADVATVPGL